MDAPTRGVKSSNAIHRAASRLPGGSNLSKKCANSECLVTYQIDALGEAVRLIMTEAHQWDVPDEILSGGRMGWPVILSSLKSLLETGKPLVVKLEPPKEMLEAVKHKVQEMKRG